MKTAPSMVLGAIGTLAIACGGETKAPKVAYGPPDTAGDTVSVRATASNTVPSLAVALDSPTVLWTPEAMGRPVTLVALPTGRVVVTDGTAIYAWSPDGDTTETVGRRGAGPGEYKRISAMLGLPDGHLMALDNGQQRLLFLGPDGSADSTVVLPQYAGYLPFLAVMDSVVLVPGQSGLVHVGEPVDTLYLRIARDSGAVIARLPLPPWMQLASGVLTGRDAYPAQPKLAGSGAQGFAFGDGLAYDIRWWRPGVTPHWLHLSRTWAPPPQSVDRVPPDSLLNHTALGAERFKQLIEGKVRGELKNSVDEFTLMENGSLWVRPVDSTYVYHPFYYFQLAELRQPTRLWEVWNRDGHLLAQVRLSSMFSPRAVSNCTLYGFLEQDTGEFSVATIPLGEVCARLTPR